NRQAEHARQDDGERGEPEPSRSRAAAENRCDGQRNGDQTDIDGRFEIVVDAAESGIAVPLVIGGIAEAIGANEAGEVMERKAVFSSRVHSRLEIASAANELRE